MHEYKTPCISTFLCRKSFHTNEKHQNESIVEWFQRVFASIDGCEYGQLSDFMLIDKFLSGLEKELFENLDIKAILTVDKLVSSVYGQFSTACEDENNDATLITPYDYSDNHFPAEIEQNDTENSGDYTHTDFYDTQNCDQQNDIAAENCDDYTHTKSYGTQNCDRVELPPNVEVKMEKSEEPLENEESTPVSTAVNVNDKEPPKTRIKGFKRVKEGIVCLDCGKCFKHKNTYNYHQRIHTGMNLCYCNYCGKMYVKEIALKVHLRTHKHDNSSFECYLCHSKFDRKRGLSIHFTTTHIEEKIRNLKCQTCAKLFYKQSDLDLHIKVHLGLVKRHHCQYENCNKSFDKASSLKDHMVVHIETSDFVCEICGLCFKTNNQMQKHIQRHDTDRRVKCPEINCDKYLASKQILKIHMRQHTGERPYTCTEPGCEKTFVTQPSLAKHVRVHRKEKPYGCKICEKRFATSYHLKLHMNMHTGAKPFVCNRCPKAYTQSGTLKQHQAKAHPE